MLQGKKTFKCDDCGHTFEALDIEWQATTYSQPMPCPNCGSRHTMPKSGATDKPCGVRTVANPKLLLNGT